MFDPRVAWNEQSPTTIPRLVGPGVSFADMSWSPDGQQLAGNAKSAGGYQTGFGAQVDTGPVVIYSLATGRFRRLYESDSASGPLWLNDGRRLMFRENSRLMLIDSQTRATRELMSLGPDTMDLCSLTRDNRTVYFVRHVEQANVWLMKVK